MPHVVRFDCFEVDLSLGQLRKRKTRIHLREQSFQVLVALLERPGDVITRDELRRRLWGTNVHVDFDNNLNIAVARLREALGDSTGRPRLIETLPRRGYRFIGTIAPAPRIERQSQRPRLLVLPFTNVSGDAAQEYFSDAMTDEIITALAVVAPDQLAVIARTTAFHYKGTHKDIGAIARETHVDYIVEGGARRVDDNVALNVQLIRVSDQAHVWAARYEVGLREVFAAQRTLAQTVCSELGLTARPDASARGRKPTDDVEAYTLYRQGRHYLLMQTPENFAAAKRCFEQAIARDPQFALAYDALADLWWYYDFMGFAPPRTVAGIGMAYALRALDIDGSLAETHALLGHYRWLFEYDWAQVGRDIDRARELDPTSPLVRVYYAFGPLLTECRLREAIDELYAALESDPLSMLIRMWLAVMLNLDRQFERALEEARRMVEIEPANYAGHWLVGACARELGLFDEAIAAHRRSLELSGGSPLMLGWYGLTLGQAGRAEEALGVLAELRAAVERQVYVPPTAFAWTYVGLGDIDNAFAWLDRAVDVSDRMMVPIQVYPFFDPLRGDPRFAQLLKKMKLPVVH